MIRHEYHFAVFYRHFQTVKWHISVSWAFKWQCNKRKQHIRLRIHIGNLFMLTEEVLETLRCLFWICVENMMVQNHFNLFIQSTEKYWKFRRRLLQSSSNLLLYLITLDQIRCDNFSLELIYCGMWAWNNRESPSSPLTSRIGAIKLHFIKLK